MSQSKRDQPVKNLWSEPFVLLDRQQQDNLLKLLQSVGGNSIFQASVLLLKPFSCLPVGVSRNLQSGSRGFQRPRGEVPPAKCQLLHHVGWLSCSTWSRRRQNGKKFQKELQSTFYFFLDPEKQRRPAENIKRLLGRWSKSHIGVRDTYKSFHRSEKSENQFMESSEQYKIYFNKLLIQSFLVTGDVKKV